jgi:uncharacterized SAM-binding protein YcdF (DUF218 family)
VGFTLSKLLWTAARPSAVVVLLLLVGIALLWTRWPRLGRIVTTIAAAILVLIATLPLGNWITAPLENQFPTMRSLPPRVDGIIALGGGFDTSLTEDRGIPSLPWAAERFTTFLMLARHYPAAKLVYAGGSGLLSPNRLGEADVAKQLLGDLGFDVSRVMFENRSRNTYENAVLSQQLVKPSADEIWLLVTSAAHMPRSVGVFRKLGWRVTAWPTHYTTHSAPAFSLGFSLSHRLQSLDNAVHEWLGVLAYHMLGRTSDLLPVP